MDKYLYDDYGLPCRVLKFLKTEQGNMVLSYAGYLKLMKQWRNTNTLFDKQIFTIPDWEDLDIVDQLTK